MATSRTVRERGLYSESCRRFKTEIASLNSFVPAEELIRSGEPQIGDIVEIDRIIYSHWALYVGDGEVAHVTGPGCDIATTTNARVARCLLRDVAGESLVRVNNKTVRAKERVVSALPCDVIVSSALRLVGGTVGYNFLTRNSEHYVTEWRYGSSWSDEAETASHAMTVFSGSPVQEHPEEAHRTMQVGINNILHSPTLCQSPTSPRYRAMSPSNLSTSPSNLAASLNNLANSPSNQTTSPSDLTTSPSYNPTRTSRNRFFGDFQEEVMTLDEGISKSRDASARDDIAVQKLNRHFDVKAAD